MVYELWTKENAERFAEYARSRRNFVDSAEVVEVVREYHLIGEAHYEVHVKLVEVTSDEYYYRITSRLIGYVDALNGE